MKKIFKKTKEKMEVIREKYSGNFGGPVPTREDIMSRPVIKKYNFKIIGFLADYEYEDLPDFAQAVFSDPAIPNDEKTLFANDFLYDYLNDNKFCRENKGKYLAFIDRKYTGVFDTKDEIYMTYSRKNINIARVGLTSINAYVSKCALNENVGSERIFKTKDNKTIYMDFKTSASYKVNCSISHVENTPALTTFPVETIYDTGADVTTFFRHDLWDYNSSCFKNIVDEWNKIGFTKEIASFVIANGSSNIVNILYFTRPMFVSIEELPQVKGYKFVLPLTADDAISCVILLGVDIINQYTSIISRFDGNVQLRIMKQRDEL